mmetsp:Transcript_14019/g.36236  ORF Transcript_14019/g.36236 Transcript_14019/m.36236 type:complete len:226 (+) Transcript_14019:567-1244(+)
MLQRVAGGSVKLAAVGGVGLVVVLLMVVVVLALVMVWLMVWQRLLLRRRLLLLPGRSGGRAPLALVLSLCALGIAMSGGFHCLRPAGLVLRAAPLAGVLVLGAPSRVVAPGVAAARVGAQDHHPQGGGPGSERGPAGRTLDRPHDRRFACGRERHVDKGWRRSVLWLVNCAAAARICFPLPLGLGPSNTAYRASGGLLPCLGDQGRDGSRERSVRCCLQIGWWVK